MLVIRLTRIGKRNQASFRVVLTEKKNPVKGKFMEILGNYSPRLKTKNFNVDRIKYWLSKGAQASPTVHNLLVSEKIVDAKKVKAWKPKKKTQEAKKVAASAAVKTEASVKESSAQEPKTEEVKEESAA